MRSKNVGARTSQRALPSLAAIGIFLAGAAVAAAQSAAEADFQRAFFLQMHEKDLAAAAQGYQSVVDNDQAPSQLRQEAARRLEAVNEDLATADLARLMPPEALAYVEISDLGPHVQELVHMLNLHAAPHAPTGREGRPLGDGLYLPERITISPALLEELKNIRGVAAAITGVRPDGVPQGVVIVHPGDSNIIRGLVESSIQFLQPVEPVGGFPTYTLENEVWIVQTARMVVVGSSQAEVAATVARLHDSNAASLADSDAFDRGAADRENATLFAWLSGPRALEQFRGKLRGEEAVIAHAVLDLEHLDSLSLAVGPTEHGLQAQLKVDLQEGHHNLAYSIIRTAPLSRRTLDYVPSGIAGLVLVGLNPPADTPPPDGRDAPQYVTAMDIGRELFANIQEMGFFVLPRTDGVVDDVPIPEMALIISVGDATKSEALWNQLLAIPTMAVPQLPPPTEIEIGELRGKEFRYPDAPPILLVRLGDDGLVLGTRGAVSAAVEAGAGETNLATDEAFQPLLGQLTPASSKAVLVDVGRALQTVASVAPPREAGDFQMVAELVGNLHVALVTDEQPTSLAVRLEATNLPDAQRLINLAVSAERERTQRNVRAAVAR